MSLNFDQEHWGKISVNEFYPLRYIFISEYGLMNEIITILVILLNLNRFSENYNRNKFVYMPFGLGSRICIGKKLIF